MTLAEKFVEALSSVNAFTVREFFVSLGTPDGGRLVIGFSDGSQACNQWLVNGDLIHDIQMTRELPNSPWIIEEKE